MNNSPRTKPQPAWRGNLRSLGLIFQRNCIYTLAPVNLAIVAFLLNIFPVQAQIIPDHTLGSEQSIVTPNGLKELIQGGALRGEHLFHSFQEFNIQNNQQVYFTNPPGINNILTRVTGLNPSQILGTLGVEGGANLFLINPRGIYFGPNAHLDVAGSFFATTADGILFNNGFAFSASNPQTPPLLNLNLTPGIQWGTNPGNITNEAALSAGKDLTLIGDNLTLQGSLQAGQDLTLKALHTLQIRDTATSPFFASSGNNLLLQGDQLVDIFALNHSQSYLVSGGEMVLKSANPVIGDAHYWSGGEFKVAGLNGEWGTLLSPTDPVIRALGDVTLNNYTGTSLHIIAGGKVTILGNIQITGPDAVRGLNETVTLSNGTTFAINGKTQATLDIRSGVNAATIGTPGYGPVPPAMPPLMPSAASIGLNMGSIPTNADIKIGSINMNQPGKILLTNQYQPNSALTGSIALLNQINNNSNASTFGEVMLDSRQNITLNGNIVAAPMGIPTNGNGGNITLLANQDITFNNTARVGVNGRLGGNITLNSGGTIALNNGQLTSESYITTPSPSTPTGGNISLQAKKITIAPNNVNSNAITTSSSGRANAGNIYLNATDSLTLNGGHITSQILSGAIGNAGNVIINARTVRASNSGIIETSTRGRGNAGNLMINAGDIILSGGTLKTSVENGAVGNGGEMLINTNTIYMTKKSFFMAGSNGLGNAGNFTLNANSVTIDGQGERTGITTSIESRGVGNVGQLNINTGSLQLRDGGEISTTILGRGTGSVATINADTIEISGSSNNGFPTGISGSIAPGGVGNAAGLNVNTRILRLSNGGQINASTAGLGNAAPVRINATESVEITGQRATALTASVNGITPPSNSGIVSSVVRGAVGNGGLIAINTPNLLLRDNGIIEASTTGQGNAGNLIVNTGVLAVSGGSLKTSVENGAVGNGGEISINTGTLAITNQGFLTAASNGLGNAGNLTIDANSITLDGRGQSALIKSSIESLGVGNTGEIKINTGSLQIRDGGQINTTISGRGLGSVVNINADTIDLSGTANNGNPAGIIGAIGPGGVGNAARIDVTTRTLSLRNGAQINASTAGTGNAAPVQINASESVQISGERSVPFTGSINGATPPSSSGIISSVESNAVGDGGVITINTPTLLLSDRGSISSSSKSQGAAGAINITANNVTLDNQGTITAESTQGDGGNISLNVRDILFLRHNSSISTSAGTTQAGGNGGNINISAGFIIAVPKENSDIIANAFRGNGGNITITTRGIYGLTFRSLTTSKSDITASSQFGLNGSVSINTLGIDPVQGLTGFPTEFADSSGLIVQNCPKNRAELAHLSQFIMAGRGGIPANPNQFLAGETVLTPWVSTDEELPVGITLSSNNHSTPPARGLGCQFVSRSGDGIPLMESSLPKKRGD